MEYVIFGAGHNAASLIEYLQKNGREPKYIVDNDENKWGSKILGITVNPVSDLLTETGKNTHILISIENRDYYLQISSQLYEMGFQEEADFSDGLKLIHFAYDLPGKVSGDIRLPNGISAIKTFDRASRLFFTREPHRIFRGLYKGYSTESLKIIDLCRVNNLFNNYIVDTNVQRNKLNLPADVILEHEYIDPVSYPFEWPPAMFCAYVDFMIDMIKKLTLSGIALIDAHALNATFSKGKFLFLDFGALRLGVTPNTALLEFINTHTIPCILFLKNQNEKAYLYLKNPGIEYTITDIKGYLKIQELNSFMKILDRLKYVNANEDVIAFMDEIYNFIHKLDRIAPETRWDNYQEDEWKWSPYKDKWSDKMRSVVSLIEMAHPSTLIDLAGNMGWYGTALHEIIKHVTIMDWDYRCMNYLWKRICLDGIKNVTPLYMSLISPTLDYYRDEMIGSTGIMPWRKNAMRRFQADLAIALAIIHHLAFSQQLNFREIVGQLALYTNRYLIVEFVDQHDPYISDWIKAGFEWYSEENFVNELKNKFEILSVHPSTPRQTRKIYFCEKRV